MIEDAQKQIINPLAEPVSVVIEETVEARFESEGGLNGDVSVNGKFECTVLDTSRAELVTFALTPQDEAHPFKYKTHPHMSKDAYTKNNTLQVKDPARPYRADMAVALVKWQLKSQDEECVPLTVTVWPSPEASGTTVIVQFELSDDTRRFDNVQVRIPCANAASAQVKNADCGETSAGPDFILWALGELSADNSNGALEVFVPGGRDPDAFLPVQVRALGGRAAKVSSSGGEK
jgi:hypothetical protein